MSKRSKKSRKSQKAQEKEKKTLRIPLWEKKPASLSMALLTILLLIFFNQVMFTSKTLLPPDTVASKSFSPFVDDALKEGTYPLWNPYIFSGMPSFASLSRAPYVEVVGTVIHGIVWTIQRVIPLTGFTRIFINYILLGAMIYLLLRAKKLRPGPALFASIAMVFMPQVIAYAAFGHTTKLGTVVLLPVIVLLVERLLEKKNLLYFSLTALAIGLQLLRLHVQICFYTYLAVAVYFIYWAVLQIKDNEKALKIVKGGVLLLGAAFAGLLLSSVINLSVWEYSHYSIRGGGATGGLAYGNATDWSFPPAEIVTYIIPSFMGFGRDTYWGPMPFTDFPLYVGLTVLLLAGLAMAIQRNRSTWYFAILALVALTLSFGKHLPLLYWPMFKFLPLFNKFRAPKMVQILYQFSLVVLAAYGIQGVMELWKERNEKSIERVRRYLLIFGGVVLLLFLFLIVFKNTYLGWAQAKWVQNDAYSRALGAYDLAVKDGLKALLIYVITAAAIWITVRQKGQAILLPFVLSLVVIADFWIVDRKFVEPRPAAEETSFFAQTPEVTYLKGREGLFRIFPVGDQRPPNWYMYYKLQNVKGYQGAKLRSYQEFMDTFIYSGYGFPKVYLTTSGGRPQFRRPETIRPEEWRAYQAFLQMMNIRYIVSPYNLTTADTNLALVHPPEHEGANGIFEYNLFLPRAHFVDEVLHVEGKEAVLGFLSSGGFDPSRMAVVETRPPFEVTGSNENKAQITDWSIHHIEIATEVAAPAFLSLSEMHYPHGWKAWADNEPIDIVKTNFAFRGVFLKPGVRTVRLQFAPANVRVGLTISLTTLGLLILGIVAGVLMERKRRVPGEAEVE